MITDVMKMYLKENWNKKNVRKFKLKYNKVTNYL